MQYKTTLYGKVIAVQGVVSLGSIDHILWGKMIAGTTASAKLHWVIVDEHDVTHTVREWD